MNNKARGFFEERPLPQFEVASQVLRRRTRRVPSYTKSQITPLKNNYNGVLPILGISLDGILPWTGSLPP
jgi:hypothetical protein